MTLPRFTSHAALQPIKYLINGLYTVQGEDVILSSTMSSSAASAPTFRHIPGTVLVYRTSSGEYEIATSANVDVSTAAAITSSGHVDTTDVIKLVGNHGTISVTVSTGTGTEANCATDLNADATFANHYIATSGGGELTITSLNTGKNEWFYMHADTAAGMGFAEGQLNGVRGTTPDVRVMTEWADTQDVDGNAIDANVPNLWAGYFDESELSFLTAEAKSILLERGSRFG